MGTVEVDPAQVVEFPFPADWPAYFRRSKAFDPRRRHRLRNVTVSPLSGLTWTPSGAVIGESIGSAYRLLGWGNVAHELAFPVSTAPIAGRVVCALSKNYGHWMFDCLPHILEAMRAHPDTTILLPAFSKDRPPFVNESLRAALGDSEFERSVHYAVQPHPVEEVVLTAMPVDPYFVHPAAVRALQSIFTPQRRENVGRRRIYVSRRRSRKRQMDNEETAEDMFASHGFEVVHSEDLSFDERVRMFSEAQTVAGPHGAGLANIVWCPTDAVVFELLPSWNFNDYYARLALMIGIGYCVVQAEPGEKAGGRIPLGSVEETLEDVDGHALRDSSGDGGIQTQRGPAPGSPVRDDRGRSADGGDQHT